MSSATSTLQVSGLPREKLKVLRAQAKAAGVTAEDYARQLLEESILVEQKARNTTFDQLFGLAQERFRKSGMTEAELDKLVDAARTRYHRGTSKKKA